jgi:Cdc6-like AAA superfamily ATPase
MARDALLEDQRASPPSWIFEHPIFHEWLSNHNPATNIMWISGTAGFGKSVLAAYLTQSLKKRFPDSPVTFFFCKGKDELCEVHQVVRTILHQLSAHSSAISQQVIAIWDEDEDLADLYSNYRIYYENLLLPVVQTFLASSPKSIYVIIDGLNELPRHRLTESLSLISALQTVPYVRVVLTSQPTKTINAAVQTACQLSLTINDNLDNVETFVKCSLNETLAALFNEIGVDPIK